MPSGKKAWLTFLTFDLLMKIAILDALLAVSMPNILLVRGFIVCYRSTKNFVSFDTKFASIPTSSGSNFTRDPSPSPTPPFLLPSLLRLSPRPPHIFFSPLPLSSSPPLPFQSLHSSLSLLHSSLNSHSLPPHSLPPSPFSLPPLLPSPPSLTFKNLQMTLLSSGCMDTTFSYSQKKGLSSPSLGMASWSRR